MLRLNLKSAAQLQRCLPPPSTSLSNRICPRGVRFPAAISILSAFEVCSTVVVVVFDRPRK